MNRFEQQLRRSAKNIPRRIPAAGNALCSECFPPPGTPRISPI
jgi:hypothetical protein